MIVTFYSYKGGVGRSMALVNVGEVLAQAGLRVLLVDFDLEAPSLETYYPEKTQTLLDSSGIIDLLDSYKRAIAPPGPLYQTFGSDLPFEDIRAAMVNVRNEASEGSVYLITVGRRSGDNMGRYANAVNAFDWRDFYDNWEGELYFRWLRQQFYAQADVTLVDCPTGITDVGGVCCDQIADAVVLLCAASAQQISGSEMMVSRLLDAKLAELRDTPLKLIVVPAKIDSAESELLADFQAKFYEVFGRSLADGLTSEDMWDSNIPFIPYYSFGTRIAVREGRRSFGLAASYTRLAKLLSRIASKDSPLFGAQSKLNALRSDS